MCVYNKMCVPLRGLIAMFAYSAISFGVSAKKFDGYLVTSQGDSMKCKIVQTFTVLSGIDVSTFQNIVTIRDNQNKVQSYDPGKIKGFGIYSDQDTLDFVSVKTKSFKLFGGEKERWFFMLVLDYKLLKLYFFIDTETTYGTNAGARRIPKYVIQKETDSVATWLEKTTDENGELSYRAFFKQYIPHEYLYFSDLRPAAPISDVLEKIHQFNLAVENK